MRQVGIDDMAFSVPSLYLPIEDLAEARGIEPDKLKLGLGLKSMSVCDVDEDVVTLAASAVLRLLKQNPEIDPSRIGRIYVGTESAIDGSKPIASYVHDLVSQYFDSKSQPDALRHTDVVDMTFACIGAVDAMQNSLYYLQAHPEKLAIVVASDIANYDLGSSGEYTQGAGAVAMLLSAEPRLMAIGPKWGIGMKSEHDFFKPIRLEWTDGRLVQLHDEKPIFDGQFSNQTYLERVQEAWAHFKDGQSLSDFAQLIFHLPYAAHGRRMSTSLLLDELRAQGQLEAICEEYGLDIEDPKLIRSFSKTDYYKDWVQQRVAASELYSSEVGNIYAGSIFLALMSALANSEPRPGDSYLMLAYGSGSKSKVFSAELMPRAAEVIGKWTGQALLDARRPIRFEQYLDLREGRCDRPIVSSKGMGQVSSGVLDTNRFERKYTLGS